MIRVHYYDRKNQNKLGSLRGSGFSRIDISHNIDNYSTLLLREEILPNENNISISGFENVYVEEDGEILFGGVIENLKATSSNIEVRAIDHRWVFSRLVLNNDFQITPDTDIVEAIDDLVIDAKLDRNIPIIFDEERSDISGSASLIFNEGDNYAKVLQKIIETIYGRWKVLYENRGNKFLGKLIVRSVLDVTPEGVGISRTKQKSEDGEVIKLVYKEGGRLGNLDDFTFTNNLKTYNSRAKIGYKQGGVSNTVDVPPLSALSKVLEQQLGIVDKYKTDYSANSEETATVVGGINQDYPKQVLKVTASPEYEKDLEVGDRINLTIESPKLTGVEDLAIRIDNIRLSRKSGYFERTLTLNAFPTQNLVGSGLLDEINKMNSNLEGLNQNYFNN